MGTPTVALLRKTTWIKASDFRLLEGAPAGFVEELKGGSRAARGAVTGVLLGAGLWGAILVMTGVVRL